MSVACAVHVLRGPCSGVLQVGRLRGAASGGAVPPEPPAGALPLDPKMMPPPGESQTCMALVCSDNRSKFVCLSIPEPCTGALIMRQTSFAGGLGGGSPSQRGARGAAPARIL